jgi:hypothetical protein
VLVLDQSADPARMHRMGEDRCLIIGEPPPIHTKLPFKVAGIVGGGLPSSIPLEGASGWIKLPARLFCDSHQLVLARRAVLNQRGKALK